METHRQASGAGQALGELVEAGVEVYQALLADLQHGRRVERRRRAIRPVLPGWRSRRRSWRCWPKGSASAPPAPGDVVQVVLPETPFYVESGGQVADTGTIVSVREPRWEIAVDDVREPVGGLIVHLGRVVRRQPASGRPGAGGGRRRPALGHHAQPHRHPPAARRAAPASWASTPARPARWSRPTGCASTSPIPQAMTPDEIARVETLVNDAILDNYPLEIVERPREQAIAEGAMALFGETYGERVRTITIGRTGRRLSYELCGGTHVPETGVIGVVPDHQRRQRRRRHPAHRGRHRARRAAAHPHPPAQPRIGGGAAGDAPPNPSPTASRRCSPRRTGC